MTPQKLILRLYFITHISQEKGLIVFGKLHMIVVLTPGIVAGCFVPTTFRPCIVRGVIGP